MSTIDLSPPAILTQNLGKCYHIYNSPRDRLRHTLLPSKSPRCREFWALQNLSLQIPKGQTLGIIGKNGSGKSTLLQLLAKTLTPTTGSLHTAGRLAAILELGSGFHPEFTGRENLLLSARILGLTTAEIEERFDAIAAFSEITPFLDQPLKTYSSGMILRLAFSLIAHVSADILIIDEALAVGDVFFVQKCMRFLRDFRHHGGTIVLVTHDAPALISLCDRALWLHDGALQHDGSPKDVLQSYLAAAHGFPPPTAQPPCNVPPQSLAASRIPPSAQNDPTPQTPPSPLKSYGALGATILSVNLLKQNQQPLHTLNGAQPATLAVTAKAHRPIAPVILGFFVKDRLGQNLFGENTAGNCSPVAAAANQMITARFDFTMPTLPAGDYTITVALAEGTQESHTLHHWIHDACAFRSLTKNDALGLVGIPMTSVHLAAGDAP